MNSDGSDSTTVAADADWDDRVSEAYHDQMGKAFGQRTRDRIHWLCSQCTGTTVLDIGCSQGIMAILLAREGMQVTGIDINPAAIDYACAALERESPEVQARIRFHRTDLFSYQAQAHDTVVLAEVLEHQAAPERMLEQAIALVRPGGRLVITTPFGLYPFPDHKNSLFPSRLVRALRGRFRIDLLEVAGGYIRLTASQCADAQLDPDLVLIATESGTIQAQRNYYDAQETIRGLKDNNTRLNRRIKTGASRQEELESLLEAERSALVQAHLRADGDQRRLELVQKQLDRLNEHLAQSQAERQAAQDRLNEQLDRAQSERQASQEALRAMMAERLAERDEAARLRLSLESSERRCETATDELDHLRHRLQRLDDQERQIEQREHDHQTQVAALDSNLRELRQKLAGAEANQQRLNQRLASLRRECDQQQSRGVANRKQLDVVQAEKDAIVHSITFRVGLALVAAARSFRGFIALPGRLLSLFAQGLRQRRRTDGPVTRPGSSSGATRSKAKEPARKPAGKHAGTSTGQKSGQLDEAGKGRIQDVAAELLDQGVPAIIAAVDQMLPNTAAATRAQGYLVASRAATAAERHDLAVALTRRGLSTHPTTGIRRNLLHQALRAQEMPLACQMLAELEAEEREGNPTAVQFLARFRKSYSYKVVVANSVPPRSPPQLEPDGRSLVYVLHNSLPHSSGGYATRTHGVATGIAAGAHKVTCLTRPGYPFDIKTNVPVDDIPESEQIDGITYLRAFSPARTGLLEHEYVLLAADRLEDDFRRLRPSIVQAASNYLTGLPALIAARRLGIPFFYEVRGFWEVTRISREPEFEQTIPFAIMRHLESVVARAADHVFTLTEPMREELVERGVSADRITLLPNSVDVERFHVTGRDHALAAELGIPADVPVIGYIGTFVGYEGLDDLVSACIGLHQRGIDFRLLLVGNENVSGTDRGPVTESILTIAQAGGIESRLIMPGRVPHEQVEAYYSLIDICPFPRKPWPVCEMVSPMKPLEALAMEKAVLVSSVRALTEMIRDGETGIVFEKGDVQSMTEALLRLVTDRQLRHDLGRTGRDWVRRERTWRQIGERIESVIAALPAPVDAVDADSDAPTRIDRRQSVA